MKIKKPLSEPQKRSLGKAIMAIQNPISATVVFK